MLCNSWKFRTKRHTVPPETEQTDMSWGKERRRMGSYFHVSGTRNVQTSITLIWMLTVGCCSSCGQDGMGLFLNTAGSAGPTDATLDQHAQRCTGENNQSYICELGHCCEDLQCCSYYYELWWFWLMCAVISFLTFCCVCRHWRVKHRLQQQQRQHEINLIAYREARNYTSPPFYFRFLPNYLLPDYEDAISHPLTPPPPYCNLNAGPPACTNSDQEEAHCQSIVPTVSTAHCSCPDVGELDNTTEPRCRGDGNDRETMSKQDTDQDRDVEVADEDKDGLMVRRRHFTGDSGIEVCLCSRGTENHRAKELEQLLHNEGHDGSMEFCDSCGAEDEKVELDASSSPPLQLHPVCLYLHTIKEQEGPQECQS